MKSFKQLREEIQLDELSKETLGSYVKKAADDLKFAAVSAGRHGERNSMKSLNYSIKQGKKANKRNTGIRQAVDKLTKEEYDVEAMLEYIEDLETQLDEISDELKNKAAKRAEAEMDKITGKYPENTTGDRSIRGVPGITPSDTNKWLKRSKQSSIFKGYTKPKVPRNQSARDDANRRAMYGYDPDKQPVKGGKSGLGS